MSVRLIILILLINISCSNEDEISKFEQSLGFEHCTTLTLLVNDFEQNYLAKQYEGFETEKAYKEFLLDIINSTIEKRIQASPNIIGELKESGLYEEVYSIIDTIWYDPLKNIYHKKSKSLLPNGDYHINEGVISDFRTVEIGKDEVIKNHYSYRDRNYSGKLWKALKQAGDKERYICEYVDLIEAMGTVSAKSLARGFINSGLDFQDYFVKRIIVTEFVTY